MAQCDVVEKPLLERIQSELKADPDLYDVTFSVGPQKTKVKALKIILLAASPVFKNEFKTKWKNAVVKEQEGIPLPEFDGESFQLFVKLTSLDAWSVESLRKHNLPLNHLLDLLFICRRYDMQNAVKSIESLTLRCFAMFKDTADFLNLSQENLKEVLASDNLAMEETEVVKCAIVWAEWKCKELKIDASVDNLRHVLGHCLSEIRFPTMSVVDFTKMIGLKNVLTDKETLEIYKYIGLDDSGRLKFDVQSLAFKSTRRNLVLPAKNESNSAELQPQQRQTPCSQEAAQTLKFKLLLSVQLKGMPTAKPLGCSTLSLFSDRRKIKSKTPFVCDGSVHGHRFEPSKRMFVFGLGFAGPIDADAFYDVTVEITNNWLDESFTGGKIRKRIVALKGQTFYFLFDKSIAVEKDPRALRIEYSLKGPNTSSIVGGHNSWETLEEESSKLYFKFESNQLSEILLSGR